MCQYKETYLMGPWKIPNIIPNISTNFYENNTHLEREIIIILKGNEETHWTETKKWETKRFVTNVKTHDVWWKNIERVHFQQRAQSVFCPGKLTEKKRKKNLGKRTDFFPLAVLLYWTRKSYEQAILCDSLSTSLQYLLDQLNSIQKLSQDEKIFKNQSCPENLKLNTNTTFCDFKSITN